MLNLESHSLAQQLSNPSNNSDITGNALLFLPTNPVDLEQFAVSPDAAVMPSGDQWTAEVIRNSSRNPISHLSVEPNKLIELETKMRFAVSKLSNGIERVLREVDDRSVLWRNRGIYPVPYSDDGLGFFPVAVENLQPDSAIVRRLLLQTTEVGFLTDFIDSIPSAVPLPSTDTDNSFDLPTVDLNLRTMTSSASLYQGEGRRVDVATVVTAYLRRAYQSGIDVSMKNLRRLKSPEEFLAKFGTIENGSTRFDDTLSSYRSFQKSFNDALTDPESVQKRSVMRSSAKSVMETMASLWIHDIQKEQGIRSEFLSMYEGVRNIGALEISDQGTRYGLWTNYPPVSYRDIFDLSKRIVAIGDTLGVHCSGFLLDDEWVMTAGHCFSGGRIDNWRDSKIILHHHSNTSTPNNLAAFEILDFWPHPAPGAKKTDTLDYAFLRITPVNQQESSVNFRVQDHPICFLNSSLSYNEPVFVVGHPEGKAMAVHDYASVRYPFEVDDATFEKLYIETAIRYRGDPVENVDEILASIDRSYIRRDQSGSGSRYYYRKFFPHIRRPTFGIDSDTAGANSGSPVFDRDCHCIAGVFNAGSGPLLGSITATWQNHEFVLPFSEVIQDLKYNHDVSVNVAGFADPASIILEKRQSLLRKIEENSVSHVDTTCRR